jgi:hypothetical protein
MTFANRPTAHGCTSAHRRPRSRSENVTELSLDHDLGLQQPDAKERSGYDVLVWIEAHVARDPAFAVPDIRIHSANPVGRARMEQALASIRRLRGASS